jgi:dolichyl-phosphate beta-glucosyltransferase
LKSAVGFLRGLGIIFEIIIINDGSNDATESIAQDFCKMGESDKEACRLISYAVNQGKGFAVGRGVKNAQGRYLLICDADGSIPPSEVKELLPFARKGVELVVGSRAVPGAKELVDQPLVRRILGRAFNLLVAVLVTRMVGDTQCGFKLLETQAAKKSSLALPSRALPLMWRCFIWQRKWGLL